MFALTQADFKRRIKIRFPVVRQVFDDLILFIQGKRKQVLIRIVFGQSLEAIKRVVRAAPPILDGCIFANHFQRDEYLVDRIVADGFFSIFLSFGPGYKLVKRALVQICKGHFPEIGLKVLVDMAFIAPKGSFRDTAGVLEQIVPGPDIITEKNLIRGFISSEQMQLFFGEILGLFAFRENITRIEKILILSEQ